MASAMSHRELLELPVSMPLWPDAARAHGLSRYAAYELHARGELPFPVLKIGRKLRVTRADLLRSLGLDPERIREAG